MKPHSDRFYVSKPSLSTLQQAFDLFGVSFVERNQHFVWSVKQKKHNNAKKSIISEKSIIMKVLHGVSSCQNLV